MKKALLLLVGAVFTLSLIGCGTVSGVGEDLKSIGGWFTKASDNIREGKK